MIDNLLASEKWMHCKHIEDVLYYKLYYSIQRFYCAAVKIQKERVGCTPGVEGRVEIFKSFFLFSHNTQHKTLTQTQTQTERFWFYILYVWINQMSLGYQPD
jgi:hypothetical protein